MKQTKLNIGDYLTNQTDCSICGSRERRLVYKIGRNFQPLETVICTGCGLIHSNPIPSKAELDEFYNKKYRSSYKFTTKPKLKHILRYAPGALSRVEMLIKYKKPEQIKLMDIGSGSGEFLYMATKAGFEAQGIEPHTGYSEYTQKILGLDVVNTTLEQAGLKESDFDIVNLNHVLEHMPAPLETLSTLRLLLKKDGILLVDVPDIVGCGHAPWTQFHYAHIYNFNHETLKALVEKAGFEILNAESRSTNLVLRKTSISKTDAAIPLAENYEMMWEKLTAHSGIEHYKTQKPYSRFIRKCYQYPKEFFIVTLLRSPRKILDKVYSEKILKLAETR